MNIQDVTFVSETSGRTHGAVDMSRVYRLEAATWTPPNSTERVPCTRLYFHGENGITIRIDMTLADAVATWKIAPPKDYYLP
jgi:hypothetical protein